MKRKSFLAIAMLLLAVFGGGGRISAQTDVTGTYLINADLEGTYASIKQPTSDRDIYQPEGWVVVYENGESNDMTSLNSSTTQWTQFSGRPQLAGGENNTYWLRFRWGNSENLTISQETKAPLPAGTYCLSADVFLQTGTGVANVSVAGKTSNISSIAQWKENKIIFELAETSKVTVSFNVTQKVQEETVFGFDNVKIISLNEKPTLPLLSDIEGTDVDLNDFPIDEGDYTLEVEGTAGTEIKVSADNLSYTPEKTGTIRFVKSKGIVYVYENAEYAGAISSELAEPTFPDVTSENVISSDKNLLSNASFETLGDLKSSNQYYPGEPWTGNYPNNARVQLGTEVGNKSGADNGDYLLVWRGSSANNIGQSVSGINPNRKYKVQVHQVYGNNGTGAFRLGLGTSVGNVSYGYVDLTLGGGDDNTHKTISGVFSTAAEVSGECFFTMTGFQGNGDRMPCIDWISLVCQNAFPITGVSSAIFVAGTGYAPATAEDAYNQALVTAKDANASDDYKNIGGKERADLVAEIGKAEPVTIDGYKEATVALLNVTEAFIAAKESYDAYAEAKAEVVDVDESKVLAVTIAGNTTVTAEDAAKAAIILSRVKVLEEASVSNALATDFVTNGTFDSNKDNWIATGGFQNTGVASNQQGDFTGKFWENWNPAAKVNKMYQTIENIPNGTYCLEIAAFVNNIANPNGSQYVYANSSKTYLKTTTPTYYEVVVFVEDNKMEIGLNQTTATTNWMGIDNVSLNYFGVEDNVAEVGYNVAIQKAKEVMSDELYVNVNSAGSEKQALQQEINKAKPTTEDGFNAAVESLTDKTFDVIFAKSSYDAFVAAAATEYEELPYASEDKYVLLSQAQEVAAPTSAEDAATKTNVIIQAYRVYLESNALAEGVYGAKVISVPDYRFAGLTRVNDSFGAWTIYDQTNGNIQLLSSESFTDGEGKSDYTYIDIYKNDNNARVQQSLELEPGKYMMTVTARCKSGMGAQFQAFAGGVWVDIPQMGNAGGQFGRGWNDVSVEFVVTEKKSVDLGVKSNWGKDIWWGATRFRLVKLAGTESANISISSAEYSTFIAPFEVEIPAGLAAYTVDGIADNGTTLVMTEVETTIPANTPVVLNGAEGVSEVSGVNVATQDSYTKGLLTGVYTETNAPVGSYVLQKKSEGVAFYYVEEGKQPKVKANRAYLTVPAEANVRALFFGDDEATAIEGLGALTESDIEGIYSANGVKVGALQKGVNIIKRVDGSSFKVMVK